MRKYKTKVQMLFNNPRFIHCYCRYHNSNDFLRGKKFFNSIGIMGLICEGQQKRLTLRALHATERSRKIKYIRNKPSSMLALVIWIMSQYYLWIFIISISLQIVICLIEYIVLFSIKNTCNRQEYIWTF